MIEQHTAIIKTKEHMEDILFKRYAHMTWGDCGLDWYVYMSSVYNIRVVGVYHMYTGIEMVAVGVMTVGQMREWARRE